MQLEVVARTMPASAEPAKTHLDRVRVLVRHGIAEARRYVWDLRSQALDKNDLSSALSDTARRLTAETAIQAKDDGHGFDYQESKNGDAKHFGLVGMQERAVRISGTLKVESSADEGTEVLVDVPING